MSVTYRFNYLIAVVFITLMATAATSHAAEKFRVCADPLNPPFSDKSFSGFENKIARLFAKKLQQTVEYTWFPQRIGFIRNTLKAKIENSDNYKCDIIMGVPASYDRTLTTLPYYHSTYVLLIAKGRGWDDITRSEALGNLPLQRQEKLRIAMFDRGPGTAWIQRMGLLEKGVPYQSMMGDHENNTAMMIEKDLRAGKIDMVILWGPMAGYVISKSPENSYTVINMQSAPGMKFDFSIAMGVRYCDKTRQKKLNELIAKHKQELHAIIASYHIPQLPIPVQKQRKDDD